MHREVLGILVVLGVGVCFALSNTLAGLAYTGGANPLSVSTVRYFLPAIILIIVLTTTGNPLLLPRREGLIACGLGFVTAIYSWSVLAAIEVLPVSLAVLIFYLFPLITSFLVVVMGWERLRMTTIVSAIVAFAGLTLALGVNADALNPIGIALAAVGALGLAIVSVVSSRVIRAGDARQVTLYIATTAAVIFLLVTLIRGEFLLPNTTAAWWGFVSNNLFFAAALIGYFVGIQMIGPVKTTLFSYIEPIVTIGAALVLLNQRLDPVQVVGVLIVVGALIVAGRASTRGRTGD
ncbi:MAG: DMT family transporter [Rhodospirillaceae bacterium]|nr:DMT family transporter [Rhodospirillaceae bacterium]MBT5943381.1 DMT family transporter [Rhodospirillaceae bacterium]MBT6405553.1 DMT family transporter [Rhodospirillaceae bacterium]MBT6535402.1 DMT family transporter [Rhodospirillaceae bacterium]